MVRPPIIETLNAVVDSIIQFMGTRDAEPSTVGADRGGHYRFDYEADRLAREILGLAGCGILSEESGLQESNSEIWVIVDPIDGSRNYAAGLPFYGPSLCAIDTDGPFAAVVHNAATGSRYTATRGGGSYVNGRRITVSRTTVVSAALVCSSIEVAVDREALRNLGAAAHELCLVADGTFDAFVADPAVQRSWDVAAGALLVQEAGGIVFSSTPLVSGNMDLLETIGILASASPDLANELLSVLGFRLHDPVRSVSCEGTRVTGPSLQPRLLTSG